MKKLILPAVAAVIVVVVYNLLMLYDNNFPYGRMRETPAIRPHETPLPVMESGVVPFGGGDAVLRVAAPGELSPPVAMTDPAVVAAGRTQYFYYCHPCHGTAFDGNGTVGQSFHPLPTDLRSPRVQAQSAGRLFQHVSFGIGGSGRQPALGTTIGAPNRWRIVAFVKSLGPR